MTLEIFVIADLDTLLIALYVELTDRIIPAQQRPRSRMGRPPLVTDAEPVCLAVAQVLLRYGDEQHWLRATQSRVGHLFLRMLGQPECNQRLKDAAPLMEAALRRLTAQPANRPHPGSTIVADKGFARTDFEDFLAEPELSLTLVRPTRKDEKPRAFPNWLSQRVEAII